MMNHRWMAALLLPAASLTGVLLGMDQRAMPWTLDPALSESVYSEVSFPPHFDERVWTTLDNTPADNPTTDAGARLGRALFYDTRLSASGTTSCASCHHQANAFSEPRATSVGHGGAVLDRNAMGLVNLRYSRAGFFWDERVDSIEAATRTALGSPIEMGHTPDSLVGVIAGDDRYPPMFAAAFGSPDIDQDRVVRAIAQFVRSMVSVDSRYDRAAANASSMDEDFVAFTALENRGKALFIDRCNLCHHIGEGEFVQFFGMFRTLQNRLDPGVEARDAGLGDISFTPGDIGTFKSSSLRNIAVTGPYMHDGRLQTLEQVIDHYANTPGVEPASRFVYSEDDKAALVAFLHTLTDESFLADPRFANPWQGQSPAEVPDGRPPAVATVTAVVDPSLTPPQRLAQGLGLRADEVDVWVGSLDADGDGVLVDAEMEPIAEVMVAAGQMRLTDRRRAVRRRGPAVFDDTLADFDRDGQVSEWEQRIAASLQRAVRLGDGGRLEVIMDRMLARWDLSLDQLQRCRQAIRDGKQAMFRATHAADLETLGDLRSLLGDERYRRFQEQVIGVDEPANEEPLPAEQRLALAMQEVLTFDADGDGTLSVQEQAALIKAMRSVSGGFGVRQADLPEGGAARVDAFVRRYLHYYDPEGQGRAQIHLLPERMHALAGEADLDGSSDLDAREIEAYVRQTAFDTTVTTGIYIGGGFANTLVRCGDAVQHLDLSPDRLQAVQQRLVHHEDEIDRITGRAQEAIFRAVSEALYPTGTATPGGSVSRGP